MSIAINSSLMLTLQYDFLNRLHIIIFIIAVESWNQFWKALDHLQIFLKLANIYFATCSVTSPTDTFAKDRLASLRVILDVSLPLMEIIASPNLRLAFSARLSSFTLGCKKLVGWNVLIRSWKAVARRQGCFEFWFGFRCGFSSKNIPKFLPTFTSRNINLTIYNTWCWHHYLHEILW